MLLGDLRPISSLVTPCQTGASVPSMRRTTFTTDCETTRKRRYAACDGRKTLSEQVKASWATRAPASDTSRGRCRERSHGLVAPMLRAPVAEATCGSLRNCRGESSPVGCYHPAPATLTRMRYKPDRAVI